MTEMANGNRMTSWEALAWAGMGCWALMAGLVAGPHTARAWGEMPLPDGGFQLGVDVVSRHWSGTLADGGDAPLARYLGQEAGNEAFTLTGALTRDIQEVRLQPTWGLSDRWNVFLVLPLVSATQTGSLTTSSSNSSAQGAASSLKSGQVSGLGDIRLISHHLFKYDDWMAFGMGYGVIMPGNADAGNVPFHALATSGPAWGYSYHARVQGYPIVGRALFDMLVEVKGYFPTVLPTFSGTKAQVFPGRETRIEMAWRQDWGGFLGEARILRYQNAGDYWEGITQDPKGGESTQLALMLGTGNLHRMETTQTPPGWQAEFQVTTTLSGYWLPHEESLAARLNWYW